MSLLGSTIVDTIKQPKKKQNKIKNKINAKKKYVTSKTFLKHKTNKQHKQTKDNKSRVNAIPNACFKINFNASKVNEMKT